MVGAGLTIRPKGIPQVIVDNKKRFTDDLPAVSISRLRATNAVTLATTAVTIRLGDVEMNVGVNHRHFPNGGSWSFFTAPCCGRRVRTLRLLDGGIFCWRCLRVRGVSYRVDPMGVPQRAAVRIPKLLARLNGGPARLHPPDSSYTLDRRHQHIAALRRCLLVVRKARLKGVDDALD